MQHDMHDGTIRQSDSWLRGHLGAYAEWAKNNNSLLILTFDEDESPADRRILTIFYGSGIRSGKYSNNIDHYTVLRTISDLAGARAIGHAAGKAPIDCVWQ